MGSSTTAEQNAYTFFGVQRTSQTLYSPKVHKVIEQQHFYETPGFSLKEGFSIDLSQIPIDTAY